MSPEAFLRNALRLLLPLAVAFTLYLYLYPVFLGCAFPLPPPITQSHEHEHEHEVIDKNSGPAAFRETLRQHFHFHFLGSTPTPTPTPTRAAPFRLLALGDPQIEGDTSIRNYGRAQTFPHLTKALHYLFAPDAQQRRLTRWTRTRRGLHDLVDFWFVDVPDFLEATRKRVDLFGNDFYLGHIYRSLRWWARPTHVAVLGDLLGSQWIGDDEFARRSWRFWNRAFRGAERVPDHVAAYPQGEYDLAGLLGVEDNDDDNDGETAAAAAAWRKRVINVAGNHDIGYAGDLTTARLGRFEEAFGKAAYELRFELPIANPTTNATIYEPETNPESDRLPPELRVVVLNDMNLDTPALEPGLQDGTYRFVNDVINTASAVEFRGHFTVVLTHVPFYKDAGICVDPPYFSFHPAGGVKEQNQLSGDATRGLLEGIFGLSGDANAAAQGKGRRGVVLNGHDHEGCDVWHYIDQNIEKPEPEPAAEPEPTAEENGSEDDGVQKEQQQEEEEPQEEEPQRPHWQAVRWNEAQRSGLPGKPGVPGLREITVRSMMADFEGNAGLLSAWFDEDAWEWRFEYADCRLGRQYYWWFVHVYDLVVLVVVAVWGVLRITTMAATAAAGLAETGTGTGTGTEAKAGVAAKAADEDKEGAGAEEEVAAAMLKESRGKEKRGASSKEGVSAEKNSKDGLITLN